MEQEHPTTECPNCEGTKTRPLDNEVAHCFDCDIDFYGEFSLE